MATSVQIPIVEYMQTTYRPDREYIDGEVLERNVGKWEHSRVQALLTGWFISQESAWQVQAATELRVQVSPSRVRIPDVVLVGLGAQPEVLTEPPIVVIEILSPDDSYSETQRRADDYRLMGVKTIWIIDPETQTGRVCTGSTWTAAARLEVAGAPIYVDLPRLFQSVQRA